MRDLALAALFLLPACTTWLAGSGAGLNAIGQQYASVSGAFAQGCHATPPTITAQNCQAFHDFQVKFSQAYPTAVGTWKAAVKAKDVAAAQGAEAVISSLAIDLTALASQALTQTGGK